MKLSKIEATLENGRFLSGQLLTFMRIFTGLEFFVGIFAVFTMVTYTEKFDFYDVAGICGGVVFGGCGIGLLYLLKRNKKLAVKVVEYLKDAVVVEAKVINISTLSLSECFYDGIKIEVKFRYNDRTYIRESGSADNIKKRTNGYDKVFRKYSNKNMNVLYSPKYNQIMFFKAD